MLKKEVTLKSGEVLEIRQSENGSVCPVCGFIFAGDPAYDWYQTVLADESLSPRYGAASFDTCPCCNVEYGNDDHIAGRSVAAAWESLRLAWLDRVEWSEKTLRQLRENLEINTETLKEAKSRLRR
jgi:hypothetical protein